MPRTRSIPWLIILLGIGFLAFTAWSIYLAARGTSAVTDTDYYSHGLRYNQTLVEQRAADSLGWRISVERSGDRLLATLGDIGQQPISGARGVLTLFRADLPQPQQLALREIAAGRYQATLPAGLAGELTAEIVFEKSGARLQRRLLLAFPPR
ncbi:MAG: hypothetical protein FIB02_07360 [Desulfuromonas sp.]|nr:hypothetical protein [Desulfuromonas sp.]